MFNTLGRFKGLNDEMGFIVLHSLAEYPAWQAEAALTATAQQLVHVGTGEGTNVWIRHTYGIIERYLPAQLKPMRAAQQQRWHFDFTAINRIHVPVALASMLLCRDPVRPRRCWRRPLDDLTLLAGDGHARRARQRLRLRRDIGPARPLRRAHGVDRDLGGADRGDPAFHRRRSARPLIAAVTGSR